MSLKKSPVPSSPPPTPPRQILAASMSERAFQRMVIEAAHHLGWIVYHIPDSRLATARGYPDLTMIRKYKGRTRLLFIELKTQKGRVRPEQKEWLSLLAECPVEVFLWRPNQWDEIVEILSRV